jgi:hypothetical protein
MNQLKKHFKKMANKKEVVEVQGTEATNEATNTDLQVSTTGLQKSEHVEKFNQLTGYFSQFEEMEAQDLESKTSVYLELEENKVYNFIFTGLVPFVTSEGEERQAAALISKTNESFINGGAVLVSACRKIKNFPCFIRIVTKDKIKSDKGKYLAMDVLAMDV